MHSATTRNDFLRFRIQGLSLASIGRQLGVSKPTLIKWNRQAQTEIDSRVAEEQQRTKQEITDSADQQLADVTRKYNALKQELLSRALRDIRTADLETLSGDLRQRIESLESAFGVPPLGGSVRPPDPTIENQNSKIENRQSSPSPNRT